MAVAVQTQMYDESKFTIESTGEYVTVYYNGQFWETADNYSEAEDDIKRVVA